MRCAFAAWILRMRSSSATSAPGSAGQTTRLGEKVNQNAFEFTLLSHTRENLLLLGPDTDQRLFHTNTNCCQETGVFWIRYVTRPLQGNACCCLAGGAAPTDSEEGKEQDTDLSIHFDHTITELTLNRTRSKQGLQTSQILRSWFRGF